MVAGIYISVEFHYSGMSTGLCHGAYPRLFTYPVGQGRVKQLNVIGAYILFHPFVEEGAEEIAPLLRTDGKVRQFGHLFTIG